MGRFSIDSAWEVLKYSRPIDYMHHLLWFPGFIMRHSLSCCLYLWVVSTSWIDYMLFRSFPIRHVFFVGCRLKHMNIYSFSVLSLLQFRVLSRIWPLWVGLLLYGIIYFSGHASTIKEKRIYTSTYLASPYNLDLLHLVWEK